MSILSLHPLSDFRKAEMLQYYLYNENGADSYSNRDNEVRYPILQSLCQYIAGKNTKNILLY